MLRYSVVMKQSHPEPHTKRSNSKLNSLRAAVLGANDGIVSVASIVVGVAGAASSKSVIFTSGIAGLAAGALSMAAGEFVSVSSQRDSEKSLLAKERTELHKYPEQELKELQDLYIAKGLKKKTAKIVAEELSAKDTFAAHIDIELGIDPHDLTNPWHAAAASAAAFFVGALIPLLAVLFAPAHVRLLITFVSVVLALILTGYLSAVASDTHRFKATIRVVLGGAIAMVITYSIGRLVGGRVS